MIGTAAPIPARTGKERPAGRRVQRLTTREIVQDADHVLPSRSGAAPGRDSTPNLTCRFRCSLGSGAAARVTGAEERDGHHPGG